MGPGNLPEQFRGHMYAVCKLGDLMTGLRNDWPMLTELHRVHKAAGGNIYEESFALILQAAATINTHRRKRFAGFFRTGDDAVPTRAGPAPKKQAIAGVELVTFTVTKFDGQEFRASLFQAKFTEFTDIVKEIVLGDGAATIQQKVNDYLKKQHPRD